MVRDATYVRCQAKDSDNAIVNDFKFKYFGGDNNGGDGYFEKKYRSSLLCWRQLDYLAQEPGQGIRHSLLTLKCYIFLLGPSIQPLDIQCVQFKKYAAIHFRCSAVPFFNHFPEK